MFGKIRAKFARLLAILAMAAIAAVANPIVSAGQAYAARSVMLETMRNSSMSAVRQAGVITTQSVVQIVIVGVLVAILVPFAINQMVGVDTSSWSATMQTVWDFLPLMIGIGLLLGFVGFFSYQQQRSGRRR